MLVGDIVVVKVFEFIDKAVVINEHPSLFLKFLDLFVDENNFVNILAEVITSFAGVTLIRHIYIYIYILFI